MMKKQGRQLATTLEHDAIDSGNQYLGKHGFEVGKHQ